MRKALWYVAIGSIVFASVSMFVFTARAQTVDAAPAAVSSAQAISPSPCREGYSIGGWNLPTSVAGGAVEGKLIYMGDSVFALYARLNGTRLQGTLSGRLVDQHGNLFAVVRGKYAGNAAGLGEFKAEINPPPFSPGTFEGKIYGRYSDPATLPDQFGKYKAEWVICP